MKLILSGLTTLGGLAWYLSGGMGGPDASRSIARPPEAVYSEIGMLFPAGTIERSGISRSGAHQTFSVKVVKDYNRSIDYLMSLDGAEVMKMSLRFEPAENGAATSVTGDLDVKQALVRFAASQNGTEPRHLPDFAVNIAMDKMVEEFGTAIEEGRPLSKTMLFPLMRFTS